MSHKFNIDGLPCTLEVQDKLDAFPDRPFMYLDLGRPSDKVLHKEPSGPRICARRSDDGKGWRLVLHADDGDPFAVFEVRHPIAGHDAEVIVEELREDLTPQQRS